MAVLDKPLVLGPVGGGVEPPLRLLGELGWRGFFEDAGRVAIRRFLARFGPARQAQRRADVVFAQNAATLQKIRTCGRVSVLTNGTVVDLGHLRFTGPRTQEVLFVGRLVGWKGPMLALRAFRYVPAPPGAADLLRGRVRAGASANVPPNAGESPTECISRDGYPARSYCRAWPRQARCSTRPFMKKRASV